MNARVSSFPGLVFSRSGLRLAGFAAVVVALAWLTSVAVAAQRAAPPTGVELVPYNGVWRQISGVVPGSLAWDAGLRPGQVVRNYYTPPDRVVIAAFERQKDATALANRLMIVSRRWSPGDDLLLLALGISAAVSMSLVMVRTARSSLSAPFFALNAAAAAQLLVASCLQVEPTWAYPASWILANVLAVGMATVALTLPARRRWRSVRLALYGGFVVVTVAYLYAATLRPSVFDSVDRIAEAFRFSCAIVSLAGLFWPVANPKVTLTGPCVAVGGFVIVLLFPAFAAQFPVVLGSAIWALVPFVVAVLSAVTLAERERPVRVFASIPWPATEARRGQSRHPGSSPSCWPDDRGAVANGWLTNGGPAGHGLGLRALSTSAPVSVEEVVLESLNRLWPATRRTDAEIRMGEMPILWIDRSRLRLLITDLLERALPVAERGPYPRLRVWTERRLDSVRVWVVVSGSPVGGQSSDSPRPTATDGGGEASAASLESVASRTEAAGRFWVDVPVVAAGGAPL